MKPISLTGTAFHLRSKAKAEAKEVNERWNATWIKNLLAFFLLDSPKKISSGKKNPRLLEGKSRGLKKEV